MAQELLTAQQWQQRSAERMAPGIFGIKIPGLDGKPHFIGTDDAEFDINFDLGEIWYRFKPHTIFHKGWIFLPISQCFALAFNPIEI